jgi:hypothetical protein
MPVYDPKDDPVRGDSRDPDEVEPFDPADIVNKRSGGEDDTTGGEENADGVETPDTSGGQEYDPDSKDPDPKKSKVDYGVRTKVTGGKVDIGGGNVPGAGEGPGAFESSGTGADPTASEWDVTEEQTVAGQLEKNYDKDSPFMQQAAEKAQRAHQAGGGQNSLMAAKAGQEAAMETAFKVSFADAATYARSAEFNAAMKNQFGLAEQRFIQNSLLSDQNYKQSVELQTQMIAGQLEGIRQEYLGKSQLMDKEFEQFFSKATYEAQLKEFAEQSGYQRQVSIQGMISNGAFLTNGFQSVMEYANREGFTPEQSAAAIKSGMAFLREGFDINEAFWASVGAGPDRGGDFPDQPFAVGYDWWDMSEYAEGS